MIVFVPAILGVVVMAVASTSRSSRAADDCLAKPGSAAPQGSHWYYRIDRPSKRQCWFLAPEGAKARRAASSKRPSAPTPSPIPPQTAEPVPLPAPEAPAETAAGETHSGFSTRWSDLPASAGSVERESTSPGNSYADESSTMHSEDDMPLVWPVLAQADFPAAQQPPASTLTSGNLLAFLTGALALAIMIGCRIFERSTARRRRRDQDGSRSGAAVSAIDVRTHVPPAAPGTNAAASRADSVRRSTAAIRRASIARARRPGDPDCDI